MPPRVSTSGAGGGAAKASKVKLGAIEQKLLDVGNLAPNREIAQMDLFNQCGLSVTAAVQDAVNVLLRKNLVQMLRTASGTILFRFLKKEEAKAIGAMDSEEKLVLDHIKDAGNLGIWTKKLRTKTGLPQTSITKVLKILEGRKVVKTVKSVKFPTQKIYMMAGLQPSVELTGGPWFTDNELDTVLVDSLKKVCYKYLSDHSLPKSQSYNPPDDPTRTIKYRPIYPVTATPFLPTVQSILDYITGLEIITVELAPAHVAALLDLMVYDGIVEKVFVGNPQDREARIAANMSVAMNGKGKKNGKGKDKKGKRRKEDSSSEEESSEDDDDDDSDDSPRKKKKKAGRKSTIKRSKSGKAKKKRARKIDSDDDDESSESEDFDSDEEAPNKKRKKKAGDSDEEMNDSDDDEEDGGRKRKKKSKRKKKDRSKKVKRSSSDSEASGSDDEAKLEDNDRKPRLDLEDGGPAAEPGEYDHHVYRVIRPYAPVIGWTDMPCGKCPVEEFCTEPSRPRAEVHKRPTTVTTAGGGAPRLKIELEGGIEGVGMLGGAGAAVGVSLAKWGEMKGQVGNGVAPVNPRDCVYFKEWLTLGGGDE